MKVVSLSDRNSQVDRPLIALGSSLAGVAVALGALGAHALKARIGSEAIGWWQTAVEYQMWHGLAVFAIGLSGIYWIRLAAFLLASGALIFSGTLYAMALGAPHWLGAVTPIGGLMMIGGWGVLAVRAATRIG